MTREAMVIIEAVCIVALAIFVLAYVIVTNKIIKDQERDIRTLRHQKRLLSIDLTYERKRVAYYKAAAGRVRAPMVTVKVIRPANVGGQERPLQSVKNNPQDLMF
jgi:hypothetical protein